MIDRLINAVIKCQNPSVVGIDTAFSYLPMEMREGALDSKDACDRILEFNKIIIDSIYDIVPAVKVQVAYYESLGVEGMALFKDTMVYAKSKGLIVIADIKRNDIGATSRAYSSAYLGKNECGDLSPFNSDMVTLNGYLGTDGIKPFVDDCKNYNKGAFVLVRTSNPSSSELQNIVSQDGRYIYEIMGDLVQDWGSKLIGRYGYSNIGAVVGATHRAEAKRLRERFKNMFFLVPGYGVQGGTSKELSVCFDENGLGAIVNSSRGIICHYRERLDLSIGEAAREAVIRMREDIVGELVAQGKDKWLN